MEKIAVVLVLIAGFLWIRTRARRQGQDMSHPLMVIGVFLLLPSLLIAENWLFDWLPGRLSLGRYSGTALEAVALGLTFLLIDRLFLVRRGTGLARLSRGRASDDQAS